VPFLQFVSQCSTLLKFLGNKIGIEYIGKNFVVNSAKHKEFDWNAMFESVCTKHSYIQSLASCNSNHESDYKWLQA